MRRLALVLAVFVFATGTTHAGDLSSASGHYAIIPGGSTIDFALSNLVGGAIRGRFTRFAGEIDIDATDLARSAVSIVIDPASVEAGEPRTTAFLKSNAVFDTTRERAITFRSTHVSQTGPVAATVEGELTARGAKGHQSFDVTMQSFDGNGIVFGVSGVVRREHYGIDVGLPIYSNDVRFDMVLMAQRH
ncbi:YceI family protein [Pararhizobium haloflavum]|uniref:YceI family protein n=1 Tax=Pararhizobium haloflavum TaxID=2037914 RepID=UPI000C19B160|nr:YceI family protein [Pararhizobium haloflavum]